MKKSVSLALRTIEDFGVQWRHFRECDYGYFASLDFLEDVLGPLLGPAEIRGSRVAEIGSGTGRIVGMLLAAGAARVWALEPSAAFEVLAENFGNEARVQLLHLAGRELPRIPDLDLVISIGVLHHIPEPAGTLAAAFRSLRPGGRILIWVYGREGNRMYLALLLPWRWLAARLPHPVLGVLAHGLEILLRPYAVLARSLSLPMCGYFRHVYGGLSTEHRRLVIYDQLNPAWARYYRREEAEALLRSAGFVGVRLHHRHGYSWTACGRKPERPEEP